MTFEIGFTEELTNTQFAPLAALCALYQHNHALEPLATVGIPMRMRDFSSASKLVQVLLSILTGCETLSEVNFRLKPETGLAAVWNWERFADQSSLSRTLDALTLKNIDELRSSTSLIRQAHSRVRDHDWRSYLWLDYDLSGLPCSPQAEESQKGYFSGKKTPRGGNWPGSVRSTTAKRSGPTCFRATSTPYSASSQPFWPQKLL
jgi:hypothetical protein